MTGIPLRQKALRVKTLKFLEKVELEGQVVFVFRGGVRSTGVRPAGGVHLCG